ncbi:MAG TPA: YciI family protein [Terriglobales bacterium]|nr:YciI family protein [Terriglobales bacterium]
MRYMLLIYQKENEGPPPPEVAEQSMAAHRVLMEEAKKLGIFGGAEPLQPTSTATTLRTREGKRVILDGPFAETKEQLAGYYILDCKDLDEAIGWASRLPLRCGGGEGCVEIRPIRSMSLPSDEASQPPYASALNG